MTRLVSSGPIPGRKASLSGKTLSELLVVSVIMMVAAGLLLPVVQKGREISLAAGCIQNMKTYYQAIISYANDHHGNVLPVNDYSNYENPKPNQLHIWQNILVVKGYLPAGKPGALYAPYSLRCPANPAGYMPGERSPKGTERYKYGTPNYLYISAAGSPVDRGKGPRPGPRLAQMLTSSKALLFEAGDWALFADPFRCDYSIDSNAIYYNPNLPAYKIADVHNGSSHVLFCDGHVRSFPKGAIDGKLADWANP